MAGASISAKELARKLGISEAAVSLALNNKPGVSTSTRMRVLAAAKEFGYDFTRKAVASATYGTICFAVYKKSGAVVADTPFFATLADGISLTCKRQSYDYVIRYLYEDERLDGEIYSLDQGGFAGIILLATEMDLPSVKRFSGLRTPLVLLDSYFETLERDCILINNIQGAFLATDYLIMKRRTQPGYLHSSYSINNFEERADGFYKAIRKNGLSSSKSVVHRLTPSQEGAYEDMRELIAAGEDLAKCYFADNDIIAIGAARALKEAGYSIPRDIAIIGFDDLPLCEIFDPPLTTVHIPIAVMGEAAVNRLIDIIERGPLHPVKIEINTVLKKRKSV